MKKISSALVSVFNKTGLDPILELLKEHQVKIISTGGTQAYIEERGLEVTPVEELTNYPSIFGGRVKTLHPNIFGGILYRREHEGDQQERDEHEVSSIDLVIVDLYPFEDTVASGATHEDIIEKIDIGGISLIRAAAKNYNDVLIVSSREQYGDVVELLTDKGCRSELSDRRLYAARAFDISSHYDTAIFNYFNSEGEVPGIKISERNKTVLRYGENPHQEGAFYGKLDDTLEKIQGKELSYNNLVDVEAAVALVEEFEGEKAFVIVKHTNACGVATANSVEEAYSKALAADPVSAFGGILATNTEVNLAVAEEIHKLFYEVLIAPSYSPEALELLSSKSKRILIKQVAKLGEKTQAKSLLGGWLVQDRDNKTDAESDLRVVTNAQPSNEEVRSLLFASKIAKHTKSNTIVLAKDGQLLSSGVGQTSRVDALHQAIKKAESFGFDLDGGVMASDAFFPFPDCVEIAHGVGIKSVIQPGGSVKDQDSIDFCDKHHMSMVFTGFRHFKH